MRRESRKMYAGQFFINEQGNVISTAITDLIERRFGRFRPLSEQELGQIETTLLEEAVEKWYVKRVAISGLRS